MATNWNLYNTRLNINGSTTRDRTINNFKTMKDKMGLDSPASKTVSMEKADKSAFADMKVFINSKTNKFEKAISPVMSTDILILGSKVKWKNFDWLITELNLDDDVLVDGTVRLCNYTLPFQNGTSTIYNEPCIVLSQSDALSGENQGSVMTLSDTQRVIYIQYNVNTSKLIEGKRIFIDQLNPKPKVYKITKVDRIYYMNGNNGLWKLTCDEGEIESADRPDILIADYVTDSPPDPNKLNCTITYKNNAEIKINGSAKNFTASFVDAEGKVVTNVNPKWTISPTEINSKLVVINNGLTIQISTKDSSILNKIFNLSIMDMYTGFTDSVNVKVVSMI